MGYKLDSVRFENIGGFTTTEFSMSDDLLLVGENNSGKTSVLRVIDWVLNSLDSSLLKGGRPLNQVESSLLVPARAIRNRARRITVKILIRDGSSRKKYGAVEGIVEIRIQFRSGSLFAKLSAPRKGESSDSEDLAVELLGRLQENYCALYVGASRDGTSEQFEQFLRSALRPKFEARLLPNGRGTATKESREVRKMVDSLSSTGQQQARTLWADVQRHLLGVFDPSVIFDVEVSPEDLVAWLVDRTLPRFSMGSHDSEHVALGGLGAGFQSLLWMALLQMSMADSHRKLLMLEEPEAFLHPSAQQTLARQLFDDGSIQTLVTTHSPVVLAEASPETVVIMRDHTAYSAAKRDGLQNEKDRSLLSTVAAQTLFERSLLLVEGPGDVAFFDALRRRMAEFIPTSILSRMRVVAVGGKANFAPWINLLSRYTDTTTGRVATDFIICADSIDAVADVKIGLRNGGMTVPQEVVHILGQIFQGTKDRSEEHIKSVHEATTVSNNTATDKCTPIHLLPIDLEYSMLSSTNDETCKDLSKKLQSTVKDRRELMSWLGSKGGCNAPGSAKAPYLRTKIAQELSWNEISPDIKDALWRWVTPAFGPMQTATRPSELLSV